MQKGLDEANRKGRQALNNEVRRCSNVKRRVGDEAAGVASGELVVIYIRLLEIDERSHLGSGFQVQNSSASVGFSKSFSWVTGRRSQLSQRRDKESLVFSRESSMRAIGMFFPAACSLNLTGQQAKAFARRDLMQAPNGIQRVPRSPKQTGIA